MYLSRLFFILSIASLSFSSDFIKKGNTTWFKVCAIDTNQNKICGHAKKFTFDFEYYAGFTKDKIILYDSERKRTKISPKEYPELQLIYRNKIYDYHAIETEKGLRYVLLLRSGNTKLYRSTIGPWLAIFISGSEFHWGKITYKYYLQTPNKNELLLLTKKNYEKKLCSEFPSGSQLNSKIGKNGYRFRDLEKIISEYEQE